MEFAPAVRPPLLRNNADECLTSATSIQYVNRGIIRSIDGHDWHKPMISSLIYALILLQTVISIKPGFVDFVDGKANVRKFEQLREGQTVQTESQSHVEIGLGPDSLLRLDENTSMVLESTDKADVSIKILSGGAVLEVSKIDKPDKIRIAVGKVKAVIDSKGVFRFSENTVSVLEGKAKIDDSSLTVQKGWQVTNVAGDYRQSKLVQNTPPGVKSFLNSPKAGFVNAVQGEANVHASDVARSDQPIQTGPASYVEVLLRPGAFMRIDEKSSVVIDSASLSDVVIRVVSGSVLIENIVPDQRLPVRVSVGGTKTLIATAG